MQLNSRTQSVERKTQFLDLTARLSNATLSNDGLSIYILTPNRRLLGIDTTFSDPQLRTLAAVPRPDGVSGDSSAGSMALSADGKTLLVLETVQSQPGTDVAADLYLYDTATWALLRQIRVGRPLQRDALAISPDGNKFYSASGPSDKMPGGADTIVEIDAKTGAITAEHSHSGEHILRLWLMPGGH